MASISPLLRRFPFINQPVLQMKPLAPLRRAVQMPSPFQIRQEMPGYLIPLAITTFSNLHSFLSLLWDSILLAVPKHKTPYAKKRSRQLAGKALKDVTNLNHCSACGRVKRAHILCPYCVALIKALWREKTYDGRSTLDLSTPGPPEENDDSSHVIPEVPTGERIPKTRKTNPFDFPEPPSKK